MMPTSRDSPTTAAVTPGQRLERRHDLIGVPVRFRGRTYWHLKDPITHRFFQLRDEEHFVWKQVETGRSLSEIAQAFSDRFHNQRVSLSQLQSFVSLLCRDGLVTSIALGQGTVLNQRRERQQRQRRTATWLNPLAIRFRGIDPDRFLNGVYPWLRFVFSKAFGLFQLVLIATGVMLVASQWKRLESDLSDWTSLITPVNALGLMLVLGAVKVLHELAHALTCKHFGGDCHEIGAMLLVFTPCLYCDVSDSWLLPNKWHRMAVSAAGMWLELVLAACATWLWWFSDAGFLHTAALNVMLVCSVSTILFNGNPLLRYDGYFLLSDLMELPNLWQQSTAWVRRMARRWILGWESYDERLFPDSHLFLTIYFLLSAIYRVFILCGVLWMLHRILEPLGLVLAARWITIVTVGGILVSPLASAYGALKDPRTGRHIRWSRAIGLAIILSAVAAGLSLISFPCHVDSPFVLRLRNGASLYVETPGRVIHALPYGSLVKQGESLATLENAEIEREVVRLSGQCKLLELEIASLRRRQISESSRTGAGLGGQIPILEKSLADFREQLESRTNEKRQLEILAPIAGTVLPVRGRVERSSEHSLRRWIGLPLEPKNHHAYLETGTMLCQLGNPKALEAIALVSQSDLDLVRAGQPVQLEAYELPGMVFAGQVTAISDAPVKVVPDELAAAKAVAFHLALDGVKEPVDTWYQATITIDRPLNDQGLNANGWGRIRVANRSLVARIARYLRQTFSM